MSPITLGVEITEVETFLLSKFDFRDGTTDFSGDERTTTSWAVAGC
jgi:hypothetical protein